MTSASPTPHGAFMRVFLASAASLLLGLTACSSDDTPASTPTTSPEASTPDATTPDPADAGAAVDTGSTLVSDGTVHVTYNLDKAGDTSFDCVVDKHRAFNHHTSGSNNNVVVSCSDGAPGLDVVIIGFNTPAKAGTTDESNPLTAVLFTKGTLDLNSGFMNADATHSVTITSFDAATEHAVGEATETFSGKGNSASVHTLTMKITYDVTCKNVP